MDASFEKFEKFTSHFYKLELALKFKTIPSSPLCTIHSMHLSQARIHLSAYATSEDGQRMGRTGRILISAYAPTITMLTMCLRFCRTLVIVYNLNGSKSGCYHNALVYSDAPSKPLGG